MRVPDGFQFFVLPRYRHGPPSKEIRIPQEQALLRPDTPPQQGLRPFPSRPQLPWSFRAQAICHPQAPQGLNLAAPLRSPQGLNLATKQGLNILAAPLDAAKK